MPTFVVTIDDKEVEVEIDRDALESCGYIHEDNLEWEGYVHEDELEYNGWVKQDEYYSPEEILKEVDHYWFIHDLPRNDLYKDLTRLIWPAS